MPSRQPRRFRGLCRCSGDSVLRKLSPPVENAPAAHCSRVLLEGILAPRGDRASGLRLHTLPPCLRRRFCGECGNGKPSALWVGRALPFPRIVGVTESEVNTSGTPTWIVSR